MADTMLIIALKSNNKCFKIKREIFFKNCKIAKLKECNGLELNIESEPIQLFVDYITEGRIPSEKSKLDKLLIIFDLLEVPKTHIRNEWENLSRLSLTKAQPINVKPGERDLRKALIFLDGKSNILTSSRNFTSFLDNASISNENLGFLHLPHSRWYSGIAKYGNSIIIAGGENTQGSRGYSKEVDMYTFNGTTVEHKSLSPMQEERYKFTLVTLNNYVYAVGGENPTDKRRIRTVERWSERENTWSSVAPMYDGLCSCSAKAVAVNNRIYVLDDRESMYYDPVKEQWQLIPLSYGHNIKWGITNAVVADDRYIYILDCSKNIFCCYDTVMGDWEHTKVEQLALMTHTYENFILLRKDIYLYAIPIFPHHADNQASKKIYCFNTIEKIWTDFGTTSYCIDETEAILMYD